MDLRIYITMNDDVFANVLLSKILLILITHDFVKMFWFATFEKLMMLLFYDEKRKKDFYSFVYR